VLDFQAIRQLHGIDPSGDRKSIRGHED